LDAPFQVVLAQVYSNGYWMRRFNCCWRWTTLLDAPFQVLLAQGFIIGCAVSFVNYLATVQVLILI
jgi:hypothetical protein